MRFYGKIETSFWQNPKVRALSERGQRLFLYLLACPHGSVTGTFVLPTGYIVADLNWDETTASKHLAELIVAEVIERDQATGLTRIVGHWGHNNVENPNVARAAVKYALALPNGPIKTATIREMMAFENKHLTPLKGELQAFLNTVSKQSAPSSETVSKAFLTTEPEPETGAGTGSSETEDEASSAPLAKLEGKDADEAVAIIAQFDNAIAQLWGSPRAWPASADLTTARRWIAAGADATLVVNVVGAVLGRKRTRGRKAPTSLSYADAAIIEALAERSGSTGREGNGRYRRQSTDAEVAEAVAEAAEHERRVARAAEAAKRVTPEAGKP